jgi:hypothetical protein
MRYMDKVLSTLVIATALHTGALAQNGDTANPSHGVVGRVTDGNAPSLSGHPNGLPTQREFLFAPDSSGHPNANPGSSTTPDASGHPH